MRQSSCPLERDNTHKVLETEKPKDRKVGDTQKQVKLFRKQGPERIENMGRKE